MSRRWAAVLGSAKVVTGRRHRHQSATARFRHHVDSGGVWTVTVKDGTGAVLRQCDVTATRESGGIRLVFGADADPTTAPVVSTDAEPDDLVAHLGCSAVEAHILHLALGAVCGC